MNGNINGNINDRPERDGKIFPAILKSGSRHLGGSLWDQIPAESLKSLESLENGQNLWNPSRIFSYCLETGIFPESLRISGFPSESSKTRQNLWNLTKICESFHRSYQKIGVSPIFGIFGILM